MASDVEIPDLTYRQQFVMEYIRRYITTRGVAPTHREINAALGKTGGAHDTLKALERMGLVRVRPGVERGIEVIEQQ